MLNHILSQRCAYDLFMLTHKKHVVENIMFCLRIPVLVGTNTMSP